MGVVHHRVDARRLLRRDVGLVDLDGARVRVGGVRVAADPHVDVRRHVHDVAGRRHGGRDRVGSAERPLGMRRRLDGVDVVVVRARMAGGAGEDLLERRHDLLRAGLRLPVARPEIPRPEHHQRLGEEHGGVEVVRMAARDLAHRIRVGAVERLPIVGRG